MVRKSTLAVGGYPIWGAILSNHIDARDWLKASMAEMVTNLLDERCIIAILVFLNICQLLAFGMLNTGPDLRKIWV